MPRERSEPIHFGFRFGPQDSIAFKKPSKKKTPQKLSADEVHDDEGPRTRILCDGLEEDRRTVTLCDGRAWSNNGATEILCNERAPLLADHQQSLSYNAPGMVVLCDGPYDKSRNDDPHHNKKPRGLRSFFKSFQQDSSASSSNQGPLESRISNWTAGVQALSGNGSSIAGKSIDTWNNDSSTVSPQDSISRIGKAAENKKKSYRSPHVDDPSSVSSHKRS